MHHRLIGYFAIVPINNPDPLILIMGRFYHVDASSSPLYDEGASGRLGDRGSAIRWVEESPYSIEHDAGETPGWSNLSDRATETSSRINTFRGTRSK